jgi:general secretion pathway protein B
MSYILDALRKADAERERDPARGIHAQPLPGPSLRTGPSGGYGPWFWVAIAGGVAAVGSVSLYLYQGKQSAAPPVAQANAPVRAPAAPVTSASVMPAPVVGTTILPAPVAAPAPIAASIEPPAPPPLPPARSALAGGRDTRASSQPNPRGPQTGTAVAQLTPAQQPATGMPPGSGATSAPGMPPGASSVPPMQGTAPAMQGGGMNPPAPGAPFTAPSMNPQQAPAAGAAMPPVPAPMPVPPPPPPPPINPPPPPPVPPPVLPPAPPTPPVAGLPADAPKLAISGGVYSSSRAQRMLIVNGQVFNEGSEIGPGVVLEEVRAKGAVLRYRGSRYTVNY